MNQTTTGENKKGKTLFDYIHEIITTLFDTINNYFLFSVIIICIVLYFFYPKINTIDISGDVVEDVNSWNHLQINVPKNKLELGGAIKKLKSQLRNSK